MRDFKVAIEPFTELRDIPWNPAGDGQNANGRRSGNFGCDLPKLILAALITTMEGLRRRHGEEERVNPAAEGAAAGGLIPVDMVGEAVASRIDDALPPEVALHDERVNRQPVQIAFAEELSHDAAAATGAIVGQDA